MFSKILVGVDGSSYSDRALAFAIDLSKKYGASVTIIHVIASPLFAFEGMVVAQPEKRLQEEGKQILIKCKELARSMGVEVDTRLVTGHPAEEISRVANEEGYDLLVVGNRGLSRVKAFLLGSISERVTRFAKCPVLIVKPPPT